MSSFAIPKQRLTAFQRWELQAFDVAHPPEVSAAERDEQQLELLRRQMELENLRQQARREGYDAGYREGTDRAAGEAARLRLLAEAFDEEARQLEQRLAGDLLALALAISKQVLRQSIRLNPETIVALINEVLIDAPQLQRARLVLHPEDAALAQNIMGEQLARSGWEIVRDPDMRRGGCRLHSPDCDIDATLERRWQRVVHSLGHEHEWSE